MPQAVLTAPEEELDNRIVRLPSNPDLPGAEETARVLAAASPEQLAEFQWLLAECRARGVTTFAAIGRFINRDAATVSKLYRGKYDAALQPLAEHVRHIRLSQADQLTTGDEPFLATLSVVVEIVQFCDLTRATRQISRIYGKNQTGKSSALRHYAETHHDAVYCKLPAGGGTNKSMWALAEAAGIPARKSDTELWQRLRRRFTRHSLLIIDEFHQAVHCGRKPNAVTVDRIRELHDDCGCGVVLCGTEHGEAMFHDSRHREFLAQTDNRGRLRLYIPTPPTKDDFSALCTAHGLGAPTGEAGPAARKIARENGIAALCDVFAVARRISAKKATPLTWEIFQTAVATLKTYGNDKRQREDAL